MTPGGTRYQDGVTRPLVDRVTELEAKLVKSSMENATAKQVKISTLALLEKFAACENRHELCDGNPTPRKCDIFRGGAVKKKFLTLLFSKNTTRRVLQMESFSAKMRQSYV